jgi:hypothetical protein
MAVNRYTGSDHAALKKRDINERRQVAGLAGASKKNAYFRTGTR